MSQKCDNEFEVWFNTHCGALNETTDKDIARRAFRAGWMHRNSMPAQDVDF